MTSPYLRRAAQHTIGKAGRASEKKLAKSLGGRQTPASGAMQGAKGDIEFTRVLMEAKSTTAASVSIMLDWLAKITAEARGKNKTPALAVSFVLPNGDARPNGEWVLVPKYVWEEHLSHGGADGLDQES
jgi:hypothetical protein